MEQQNDPIELSHLFCDNNKSAKLFCCKDNCINCALVCRHEDCDCLPKQHQGCEFIYAEHIVNRVMKKKRVLTKELDEGFKAVQRLYQSAIEQFSKDKEKLIVWKDNYGLNEDESKFLNAILENNKTELVGKFIHKIKIGLSESDGSQRQWFNEVEVTNFWNNQQKKFTELRRSITELYKSSACYFGQSLMMDFSTQSSKNFQINPSTKVIQKIRGQSQWHCLIGQKPLSNQQNHSFQIVLNQTSNSLIMFGIATQKAKQMRNVYCTEQSICYYAANGFVYSGGIGKKLGYIVYPGSRVRVQIEPSNKKISWFCDGQFLCSTNIDNKFMQNKIYAVVQVYNQGDSFTIQKPKK